MEILKNRYIWKTSAYGGHTKGNFWNTGVEYASLRGKRFIDISELVSPFSQV